MLKIWGRRNSSNVRKVLWCAEEIGLPYESIEVGGSHGGTQTPEYQAMNPNGLVPVIEDHGLPLWESNAIVRYLSARYALGTLYADTISQLRPRIMVQGNPHYLGQAGVVSEIRALLLAAVRSALLWRQVGGSQWQFLLGRRAMLEAVQRQLR